MPFFRTVFFFCALATCSGAWGQTPAPPAYEAEALRYFLDVLVPRDHPAYRKLNYSGYVSPTAFSFQVFSPCFSTLDSLQHEETAGTLRIRSQPTGKAVPTPAGTAYKVVRKAGRSVPSVSLCDALELRNRRVVPIYLSALYHYTDCYYISMDTAGHVVSACRKGVIQ